MLIQIYLKFRLYVLKYQFGCGISKMVGPKRQNRLLAKTEHTQKIFLKHSLMIYDLCSWQKMALNSRKMDIYQLQICQVKIFKIL